MGNVKTNRRVDVRTGQVILGSHDLMVSTARPAYVATFRSGVSIMVLDQSGEKCLCAKCLTPTERDALYRWLESIPEPPGCLGREDGVAE